MKGISMFYPDAELRFINEDLGYGVFATRLIPRGTIIWTQCLFDRVVTHDEYILLPQAYRALVIKYGYLCSEEDYVVCWDLGRYINHSCDPNCFSMNEQVDIAVRDIHPGEQITCDYGSLNVEEDMLCCCSASNCRGVVHRDDAVRFGEHWDTLVLAAIPAVRQVPQPLLQFILDIAALTALLVNPEKVTKHASYYIAERGIA
jgi:hypothetical protein